MEFVFILFIPMILAMIIPIFYKKIPGIHTGWVVLIAPVVLFIYYCTYVPSISVGQTFTSQFNWIPSLDIAVVSYLDGLSLLFSLLITGIGTLVVFYSIFYLDRTREKLHLFYVYLLLFMTAMLGVVQSDHMITLYMFWELTSISSFLLIGYWYKRERSRYGALKSMMITVFGGLMMFAAFLMLAEIGGTYSIRELIANANGMIESQLYLWALFLLLLGAFTKSAQFPFYIWLPDAMEAPTPVSAYLHSATMVKAGLYLVARFTPIFAFSEYWVWTVTSVGLFTMLWASFFAVKQTDLKGILAFSTVSQLGLIMSLLGAASFAFHVENPAETIFKYAAFAAIFHLINHATFKGSLFMVAGIIDHEAGTRDIRKLGGLMSVMPISFTIAFIGTFSMAGIPPFNGFLSKEMFLTSILSIQEFSSFSMNQYFYLFLAIAWIGSIFTFVYSMYFVFHTFIGKRHQDLLPKQPHEAPIGMLIAPAILAVLVVVIFFIPNIIGDTFIKPAVIAIQPFLYTSPEEVPIHVAAWHGFKMEFWLTVGVIAIGFILFKLIPKWRRVYELVPDSVSLNAMYNLIMAFFETGVNKISSSYMRGSIRHYLHYMFYGFIVLVIGTLFLTNAFVLDITKLSPIHLYEVILILVLFAGTLTILLAKSRLTSIIALGAVGYTVALFFVIFKAPDLALTQLVIETVSVALFLLAFYHLPKLNRHEKRIRFRIHNAIVAFGVGVTVTLVALAAQSQKFVSSISSYYKETVYKEAGGENMVNVILVDYRGFDTLFEIAVLAIASLGIIGMIKLRLTKKKGEKPVENK
ncbi:Na+/H+ antiporter subunit A [Paenisporosarcina cavernae]|uniref:Na+/H+ antiporter subunit A n=1 Tax=Paenisporosarcina cavernae TaxID=2320858 RepID=A0A385YW87_9BACL|nr:Na+/H+ antiporter subunit A [Paenisporosarcina cavernae]AYC29948.1 Na+/H+ antiporter subunit A [Paenisporosarcina cavernae]